MYYRLHNNKTVKIGLLFRVLFYSLRSRNYKNEWNTISFGPQHFREGLVLCFSKIYSNEAFLETTHLPLHACIAMLKALRRNYLHGAELFLKNLQLFFGPKDPSHFMEPESSLRCTQKPDSCPCPDPVESSSLSQVLFLRSILLLTSYLWLGPSFRLNSSKHASSNLTQC
jgi:hypothetical protein